MRLDEPTIKKTLHNAGIYIPKSEVARTMGEAHVIATHFPIGTVVKAVAPLAKKAKQGAVISCSTPDESATAANRLLNSSIGGHQITSLLVEEKIDILHEYYLSMTYDALSRAPVVLIGEHGGIDVEGVSDQEAKVHRVPVDPLTLEMVTDSAIAWEAVGLPAEMIEQASLLTRELLLLALRIDATLLEINPLALTRSGALCAVGALCEIDDAARFRQPSYFESNSAANTLGRPMTSLEVLVHQADERYPGMGGVQFVQLEGDIGFAVMGGGASLFTFDSIRRIGGRPANYSDISPGPGFEDKLSTLLRAILSQPGLRGLIYGWNILSFARGLVAGSEALISLLSEMNLQIPVVARVAGVGEELARKPLEGHPHVTLLPPRASLTDAAQLIVQLCPSPAARRSA